MEKRNLKNIENEQSYDFLNWDHEYEVDEKHDFMLFPNHGDIGQKQYIRNFFSDMHSEKPLLVFLTPTWQSTDRGVPYYNYCVSTTWQLLNIGFLNFSRTFKQSIYAC
jgi:hypothetical protein